MTRQRCADVIVVGAGLAGLSVAWHLAPTARVLVLDQGSGPGEEASAQNAGMVRRLGEDPFERALAVRTAARLSGLAEQHPEDWAASPAHRTGALLALGRDPHHLHDAVAHLRAVGVRVEACDRPAELAPVLAGAPPLAAWYLPDELVADAWSLVQGFRSGLRRAGGQVQTGTRALALLRNGARVIGVNTDQGDVFADRVVLAAGAWSAALARSIGLERALVPLRRSLLMGGPHPLSRPDHPWTWVDDVGIYARPEGGGWLLSACDEVVDWPAPGPGSRGPAEEWHRALAADKLARWMPPLAGLRLKGGWTGLRTLPPTAGPCWGRAGAPGLWWAAGLGALG